MQCSADNKEHRLTRSVLRRPITLTSPVSGNLEGPSWMNRSPPPAPGACGRLGPATECRQIKTGVGLRGFPRFGNCCARGTRVLGDRDTTFVDGLVHGPTMHCCRVGNWRYRRASGWTRVIKGFYNADTCCRMLGKALLGSGGRILRTGVMTPELGGPP